MTLLNQASVAGDSKLLNNSESCLINSFQLGKKEAVPLVEKEIRPPCHNLKGHAFAICIFLNYIMGYAET